METRQQSLPGLAQSSGLRKEPKSMACKVWRGRSASDLGGQARKAGFLSGQCWCSFLFYKKKC